MSILAQCPICRNKQSIKNKICKCGEKLDKAKRSGRIRYWINFRTPDGKQRREFIGYSIEEARDADGKRRVQKRENRIFDMLPNANMSFRELTQWFNEIEKNRMVAGEISPDYLKVKKINLDSFNNMFGDWIVKNITPEDLSHYKAKRKQVNKSDSYIDQEIGAAKSMINTAFLNRKVDGETLRVFKSCKKLLKRGSNARRRTLTYSEYKALYEASAEHLKPIIAMGFWTGMRRGEILDLTWKKLDLSLRMIHLAPRDTKEGYAKRIPISKTLRSILMQLPGRGTDGYVFTYAGKKLSDIREALKSACKDAGIDYGRNVEGGFVFHDLRHTAKTNARKSGVDRNIRMIMFGHSDGNDMDFRYDTIDDQDLLTSIDQIEIYLENVDQTVDQEQKNGPQ